MSFNVDRDDEGIIIHPDGTRAQPWQHSSTDPVGPVCCIRCSQSLHYCIMCHLRVPYGISGTVLTWISLYSTDHQHTIQQSVCLSFWNTVIAGVHQVKCAAGLRPPVLSICFIRYHSCAINCRSLSAFSSVL